jgi:hypothetical protein
MAPLKKHLTPLSRKGTVSVNRGKGSQMTDKNSPVISNPFQANLNDYSKASPSAPPMSTPDTTSDFG